MTKYNVHIYREMRLHFAGIEAATPEEAAKKARAMLASESQSVCECEGRTFAATVDLQGDHGFSATRHIDFVPESL